MLADGTHVPYVADGPSRAMLLNHQEYSKSGWIGKRASIFSDGGLRCVTWNTRGLIGSPASPQLFGKRNTSILHDLPRIMISFVFKKSMGNMNFYSIHKGLLLDGAMATRAVCRDQNCFHSQVLRCRPQWPYCEIALRLSLTSAICRGLQWYTMGCIHPSQRCISSRQMTDNIFAIETAALAHVSCPT